MSNGKVLSECSPLSHMYSSSSLLKMLSRWTEIHSSRQDTDTNNVLATFPKRGQIRTQCAKISVARSSHMKMVIQSAQGCFWAVADYWACGRDGQFSAFLTMKRPSASPLLNIPSCSALRRLTTVIFLHLIMSRCPWTTDGLAASLPFIALQPLLPWTKTAAAVVMWCLDLRMQIRSQPSQSGLHFVVTCF